MGGVARRIRKSVGKVFQEVGKGVGVVPSKKEQEAAMKAQQEVKTVDAPGAEPEEVVYSGQTEERHKKKKRKKTTTIATGSEGVIGGAPTEKTTLLGG